MQPQEKETPALPDNTPNRTETPKQRDALEAERGKQHQTNAKCNGAEARNEAKRLVTKEAQQNTMQKN